ncbi:hypothetical protein [Rhodanobacter lindaniclasticus]
MPARTARFPDRRQPGLLAGLPQHQPHEQDAGLARSIRYAGNNYDAAATVAGKLNFDFGSASYRWWFGHGGDVFGLGLGGAYYRVHAGVGGEASVGGEAVVQAPSSTGDSAWAPMLQLGWRHTFNEQWRMYVDAAGIEEGRWPASAATCSTPRSAWNGSVARPSSAQKIGYSHVMLHQRKHAYDADLDMKLGAEERLPALARLESGTALEQRQSINVVGVAIDVIEELTPVIADSGAELGFSHDARPVLVQGHEAALAALLRNLIENAMRHVPAGGQGAVVDRAGRGRRRHRRGRRRPRHPARTPRRGVRPLPPRVLQPRRRFTAWACRSCNRPRS